MEASDLLEWSSKCMFLCKNCEDFSSNIRGRMFAHLKQCRQLKPKKFKSNVRAITMIEKVTHTCKICKKKISWDNGIIAQHLRLLHRSTLKDYYDKFFLDNDDEVSDEGYVDEDFCEHDKEYRKWASKCLFECKICKTYKTNIHGSIRQHMKRNHSMMLCEYIKIHGSPLVQRIDHKCRICGNEFRWETRSMQNHMRLMHKMTLESYYIKYFKGQQGETTDTGLAPKDKSYIEWASRCLFKCRICPDYSTEKRDGLRNHLNKKHDMKVAQYMAKYGNPMIKKVIHTCKICQDQVPWDLVHLNRHVYTEHKCTVSNYYHKYIKEDMSDNNKDCDNQEASNDEKQSDFDLWAAGNIYSCHKCGKYKSIRVKTMRRHILKHERMTMKQYVHKYGELKLSIKRQSCRLCNKKIKMDQREFQQHVNSHHKISFKDYFNYFVR